MVALAILMCGAFWLGAYVLLGPAMVQAVAVVLVLLAGYGIWSDLARDGRDHDVAYGRWDRWHG